MADELIEKMRMELRRGSLTIAVLAQLRAEHYGFRCARRSRSSASRSTKALYRCCAASSRRAS
jgi:hypothetical protein